MRLFNRFNDWAHSDTCTYLLIGVSIVYVLLVMGLTVAGVLVQS